MEGCDVSAVNIRTKKKYRYQFEDHFKKCVDFILEISDNT